MGDSKIGCLILSIGTSQFFLFGFFFHLFFFLHYFRRSKNEGATFRDDCHRLVHTTTGELIPTRRERINGIVDRLTRVKLLKDVPARGRRNECLDKDEICGPYGGPRVTPCCSPYVCKSSLLLPYCRPK